MKPSRRRQLIADLLLLLVTAVWGGTFVMVKDAVSAYPVFGFLTIRFALASVALLPVAGGHLRGLGWRGWGAGALIGLFLFAGYGLQTVGLRYTSASKAGLITGLSVVIVPLLSALLIRRRPAPGALLGVGLATVGLVLLTLGPANQLVAERGDLIVLGCALGFALHIVSVSIFAPRMDPLGLTLVQVLTVGLLSLAMSYIEGEWAAPTGPVWFAAAFTGVLATAMAFAAQNLVQRFTTPTHTALIFTAEPVFAAAFGVLLAGETLLPRGLAGGLLIVAATVASEIDWSEQAAARVVRWASPAVALAPPLLCLALCGPTGTSQGLLWAGVVWALAILAPALVRRLPLGEGRVALAGAPGTAMAMGGGSPGGPPRPGLRLAREAAQLIAPLAALGLAVAAEAPRPYALLAGLAAGAVALRLLVRTRAISHAVASTAAAATALTSLLGVAAAPTFLLVPVVAWARVRAGGDSPTYSLMGGVGGVLATLMVLRAAGLG